jgi:hypothetical protein
LHAIPGVPRTARCGVADNLRLGVLVGGDARRHGGATSRSSTDMLHTTRAPRPRHPLPAFAALLVGAALLAGCGTAEGTADAIPSEPAAASDDTTSEPVANDDASDTPAEPTSETTGPATDAAADTDEGEPAGASGRLDVELDGTDLRVVDAEGARILGWSLPTEQGEVFHALLSRPEVPTGEVDAVVVTIRGEVPRLWHLRVLAGEDGALLPFPEHLQPQSEMEAVISVSWTPDAGSLLWTEPTSDGVTLRTVGWQEGPGTGRTADDHASFPLELPADATVDGTLVEADGTWTVSLLDGIGAWHELTMVRQADGALVLVS